MNNVSKFTKLAVGAVLQVTVFNQAVGALTPRSGRTTTTLVVTRRTTGREKDRSDTVFRVIEVNITTIYTDVFEAEDANPGVKEITHSNHTHNITAQELFDKGYQILIPAAVKDLVEETA